MLRFTIRDLLWLMMVMGLAMGWWADREHLNKRVTRAEANRDSYLHMLDFAVNPDPPRPGVHDDRDIPPEIKAAIAANAKHMRDRKQATP